MSNLDISDEKFDRYFTAGNKHSLLCLFPAVKIVFLTLILRILLKKKDHMRVSGGNAYIQHIIYTYLNNLMKNLRHGYPSTTHTTPCNKLISDNLKTDVGDNASEDDIKK
jgi:hypothetical protein